MITAKELKNKWFKFFKEKGFVKISSFSLIPENDATVLFTTAGMHPLVPYLLGEKHPAGNKIVDVQKCVRTTDIDEVGDASHLTYFEMLGNWTLGECDKKTMIKNSFEFLTSKDYLGIDKDKIAVSVFAGDENAPRDDEAFEAWKEVGIKEIFFLPKKHNWWALGGGTGPCGPDTEMFIDTGKPKCCENCSPACDCGKYLEIWNDVFMQYYVEKEGEKPQKLNNPNIDTGMGLERTLCVLNGVKSIYDIGIFKDVIDFIEANSDIKYLDNKKAYRIIADHLRASSFIIGDERGVLPSNVGQGYILRRLIRRAVNYSREINFNVEKFSQIVDIYVDEYQDEYEDIKLNREKIKLELSKEVTKFQNTLLDGHKEFERVTSNLKEKQIDGKAAFRLYDTFGFPIELTIELAKDKGLEVDLEGYKEAFKKHQEISREGANGTFKGGLADTSNESAKLHTATHIMLAGLRKMFGDNIEQRGSNITPERLRFDFNLDRKMTSDELQELEDYVNSVIKKSIPVICEEMSLDEAKLSGALGIFTNKYGDKVKVYTISGISKEICGGPHAENTNDLHHFKIIKEESSSSGIRRIKAVLD